MAAVVATGGRIRRPLHSGPLQKEQTHAACEAACRACADECGTHASMRGNCRICAEGCRRCDNACRELAAALR